MTLPIIYRDEDYIAINKPSGLLVHQSSIDKNETQFAIQLLRDQIKQMVYPVHRLDKPTSGILIFALNKPALIALSKQFTDSQRFALVKSYTAIVRGFLAPKGFIDHPVKAIKNFKHEETIAIPAQTHFECISTTIYPVKIDRYPESRFSLVKLTPLTGRRHQLRYHMKHYSHPIIGDAKYGKGRYNRYFAQHLDCNRLLLAATELTFNHPITLNKVIIKASVGEDFLRTMNQLGFNNEIGSVY